MMVWLLFIIDLMGLFFYNKIGSIISIGDLPTTNIIEPDYRNPNYTEKIKLQRFFTQLQIAASFFKEHFVGKIMYYETEIESVELHFSPTNFGSSEYIVELLS